MTLNTLNTDSFLCINLYLSKVANKKIKEKNIYISHLKEKKKMLTFAKEKARNNISLLSYISFTINEVSLQYLNIIRRKMLYLKSIDFRIKLPQEG